MMVAVRRKWVSYCCRERGQRGHSSVGRQMAHSPPCRAILCACVASDPRSWSPLCASVVSLSQTGPDGDELAKKFTWALFAWCACALAVQPVLGGCSI
jgi:hypothetical protein